MYELLESNKHVGHPDIGTNSPNYEKLYIDSQNARIQELHELTKMRQQTIQTLAEKHVVPSVPRIPNIPTPRCVDIPQSGVNAITDDMRRNGKTGVDRDSTASSKKTIHHRAEKQAEHTERLNSVKNRDHDKTRSRLDVVIMGDSMLNGLEEVQMRKDHQVKSPQPSGCDIDTNAAPRGGPNPRQA